MPSSRAFVTMRCPCSRSLFVTCEGRGCELNRVRDACHDGASRRGAQSTRCTLACMHKDRRFSGGSRVKCLRTIYAFCATRAASLSASWIASLVLLKEVLLTALESGPLGDVTSVDVSVDGTGDAGGGTGTAGVTACHACWHVSVTRVSGLRGRQWNCLMCQKREVLLSPVLSRALPQPQGAPGWLVLSS